MSMRRFRFMGAVLLAASVAHAGTAFAEPRLRRAPDPSPHVRPARAPDAPAPSLRPPVSIAPEVRPATTGASVAPGGQVQLGSQFASAAPRSPPPAPPPKPPPTPPPKPTRVEPKAAPVLAAVPQPKAKAAVTPPKEKARRVKEREVVKAAVVTPEVRPAPTPKPAASTRPEPGGLGRAALETRDKLRRLSGQLAPGKIREMAGAAIRKIEQAIPGKARAPKAMASGPSAPARRPQQVASVVVTSNGSTRRIGGGGGEPPSRRPQVAANDNRPGPAPRDAGDHILYGKPDGRGGHTGGHLAGIDAPGKTKFPPTWNRDKIINEVQRITMNKSIPATPDRGRFIKTASVDGVNIKVVLDKNGGIVTAYPISPPPRKQ